MLNAAVLGLGSWARTLVESVQGKSAKIRFTRAVTRTPSKAEDFARKHGFPVDDDFTKLLADQTVDAVVIATPHSQHLDQVRAAAKSGKHVFAEKPLTLGRKDAAAVVAACRRAGVVLAVGHNRRFLPLVAELKRMVDGGALGGWSSAATQTWTPSANQSGVHTVTVKARDGDGGEASRDAEVYVVRPPIQHP